MANRLQDKHIDEYLKEHRQSDDEIMQHVIDVITINRLTLADAAAVLMSAYRNILAMPHNREQVDTVLQELAVSGVISQDDADTLSITAVTKLMQLLAATYHPTRVNRGTEQ